MFKVFVLSHKGEHLLTTYQCVSCQTVIEPLKAVVSKAR